MILKVMMRIIKKKLTKRQQGQMQIRRRPTGTKKVKTAKNIRKEGHKGTQLRNEDRSINNKGHKRSGQS